MKIRRKREPAPTGIRAAFTGGNTATVPAPSPMPWGWQAAPADTLLRVLTGAGYGDAERIHGGQHAASFRIRREGSTLFVVWYYGGGFSLAATEGDLPRDLVAAVVAFADREIDARRPEPQTDRELGALEGEEDARELG